MTEINCVGEQEKDAYAPLMASLCLLEGQLWGWNFFLQRRSQNHCLPVRVWLFGIKKRQCWVLVGPNEKRGLGTLPLGCHAHSTGLPFPEIALVSVWVSSESLAGFHCEKSICILSKLFSPILRFGFCIKWLISCYSNVVRITNVSNAEILRDLSVGFFLFRKNLAMKSSFWTIMMQFLESKHDMVESLNGWQALHKAALFILQHCEDF